MRTPFLPATCRCSPTTQHQRPHSHPPPSPHTDHQRHQPPHLSLPPPSHLCTHLPQLAPSPPNETVPHLWWLKYINYIIMLCLFSQPFNYINQWVMPALARGLIIHDSSYRIIIHDIVKNRQRDQRVSTFFRHINSELLPIVQR